MRIEVDYDKCDGNAVCESFAPEVFEVRSDGFLHLLQREPGNELRRACEDAAAGCPTGAITLIY